MLVDTLGLLLRVLVLPADRSDAEGGLDLLAEAGRLFRRLRKLWADSAYAGTFEDWVGTTLGWDVEVVQRPAAPAGFVVQRKRWIVERTLAWLSRQRRLAKDYEHLAECSEAHLYLASMHLLLNRLAPASG